MSVSTKGWPWATPFFVGPMRVVPVAGPVGAPALGAPVPSLPANERGSQKGARRNLIDVSMWQRGRSRFLRTMLRSLAGQLGVLHGPATGTTLLGQGRSRVPAASPQRASRPCSANAGNVDVASVESARREEREGWDLKSVEGAELTRKRRWGSTAKSESGPDISSIAGNQSGEHLFAVVRQLREARVTRASRGRPDRCSSNPNPPSPRAPHRARST